jgi:hypothetical protein
MVGRNGPRIFPGRRATTVPRGGPEPEPSARGSVRAGLQGPWDLQFSHILAQAAEVDVDLHQDEGCFSNWNLMQIRDNIRIT